MHTRTVEAHETLRRHEMVSVTGDGARRYTGEGATTNVELGLVTEDVEAGQRGEISIFITLPQVSSTEKEPTQTDDTSYEARIFDAQAGGVWRQLSAAVNTLCKNQRGRQTIASVIDEDDIVVRSTTMWKAFGFILDASRRQLVGWGHRQANAVIVRMRHHQPTIDYVARRTADGRTRREIIRCLKRFLAR